MKYCYFTSIVPEYIAKELKELGYDGECKHYCTESGSKRTSIVPRNWNIGKNLSFPSFAELFDWFLEKGVSISINIEPIENGGWSGNISKVKEPHHHIITQIEDDWHSVANTCIKIAFEFYLKLKNHE